jgi:hypothetical protein
MYEIPFDIFGERVQKKHKERLRDGLAVPEMGLSSAWSFSNIG